MGFRTVAASLVCKATYHLLRLMGRGGTSLPGKLALKIDPNFLSTLGRGVRTIVITGTNGKTTSTHIVAQALANEGIEAFYNRSGANLIQGITTEFAIRSSVTGKPHYQVAAIESDEGALRRVCKALDPEVLVVTNVFRDQLDRYGEVMHTLDNIRAGVVNSPHATLVLNADDSMVASLADEVENEVRFFGVSTEIYPRRVPDLSDATHCIKCGAPYEYDYVTYAHLGGFVCPSCGYRRPEPSVAVTRILERRTDSCTLEFSVDGAMRTADVDVPAGYDIYNCTCVVAGLTAFGLDEDSAFRALAHFKHGFGRGERFDINGTEVRLMLMKNPAGCNQIINLLLNEPDQSMGIACILNDQECDGTDVSWIYDAAWESICELKHEALCSGERAEDMALRLKYAGMPAKGIRIIKDYDELIRALGELDHPVTVVANYSAMLAFRGKVAAALGLAGFWEG
ncbi:MAG: MurT ligase domain-containing protein [Coriobacteriales bacterium]|jgi:UDP-N-acetylmuramyl tripeptide synthase